MPRSMSPSAISRAISPTCAYVTSCHAPSALCRAATRSPYWSAARTIRSAIVFEPVDVATVLVPACMLVLLRERLVRRGDSMPPRAGSAAERWRRLRGDAGGRGLLRHVADVGQEEGLVDAALEDRDAQFDTLRDDFLALEAGLASELRGRQVICHWRGVLPSCDCNVLHI